MYLKRYVALFLTTRKILAHTTRQYARNIFLRSLDGRLVTGNFVRDKKWHRSLHLSQAPLQLVPFKLSDIGEGIREVVIKEWYVNVGDTVHQFDPICEVQSDKATVTITSRYDGIVRALHFEPQETCNVGQALVDIELLGKNVAGAENAKEHTDPPTSTEVSTSTPTLDRNESKVLATPSVRRLAMEHQIKLSDITGTGKGGRILKEDILNFLDGGRRTPQPEISVPLTSSTPMQKETGDKVVPLSIIQKAMKATMTASNQIPHFVLSDELDLTKLVQLRDELNHMLSSKHDVKLTYMPFFLKAASLALAQFPILNAYTDETCDNIIYKTSHNICVAMDTPDGLLVPSVKSVDRMSVVEIAKELKRLQDLALRGKLGTSELSGGTMTISNIGSIGGTYTAPRILPPQVLIGGLGRIQRLPRFDGEGHVVIGNILNVSWAADHRVIDGATVAKFSSLWASYLERPVLLLAHLR